MILVFCIKINTYVITLTERIGVFVCHCGRNIAEMVDVKKVVQEIAKHPLVVHAEDYKYMCSAPGQDLIRKAIKEKNLTSIIVAACSPSLHLVTFRTAAKSVGLNPYKVEMANIREQNSWVHEDRKSATEKAISIIKAIIEKVARNSPLSPVRSKVTKRCLVIGGGIAGIQAALDVANAGFEVILVEKSPTIGGRMAQLAETFPTLDCAQCILTPKMSEVSRHPNIRLYTLSEVVEVSGYVGNFKVKIKKKPRYVDIEACNLCGECEEVCPALILDDGYNRELAVRKAIYMPFPQAVPSAYVIDMENCKGVACSKCVEVCDQDAINLYEKEEIIEFDVGAIIVATGFDLLPKEKIGEYGYGRYEDVVDSLQFERILSATGPTGGEIKRHSDGKVPKKIAFVQCAGSRDKNYLPYCSGICCMYTAKHALLYKHLVPDGDAYIFYIDIRAFSKGYEEFIKRVQEECGVKYVRGKVSKIYKDGDSLVVRAVDTITGEIFKEKFDMVVLAMGIVPNAKEVAEVLRIPVDENGFLQEVHPKLRPVETPMGGIFICGVAQGPKDIQTSVAQASGAASKAIEILSKDEIEKEPTVARIDKNLCTRCGICVNVCPYSAIRMTPEGAEVIEVSCEGCGTCVSSCPVGAISLENMTDEQIFRMVEAMLGGPVRVEEKPAVV